MRRAATPPTPPPPGPPPGRANGTHTGAGLFFYEVAAARFRPLGTRSTAWPA
ncbi:hypothetical protein ACIPUC_04080 [Streptomyces sp. LARHCF249]